MCHELYGTDYKCGWLVDKDSDSESEKMCVHNKNCSDYTYVSLDEDNPYRYGY